MVVQGECERLDPAAVGGRHRVLLQDAVNLRVRMTMKWCETSSGWIEIYACICISHMHVSGATLPSERAGAPAHMQLSPDTRVFVQPDERTSSLSATALHYASAFCTRLCRQRRQLVSLLGGEGDVVGVGQRLAPGGQHLGGGLVQAGHRLQSNGQR